MYSRIIKPLIDKGIAFILMLLLAPFFMLAVIALMISLKTNQIFFLQKRPGYKAEVFNIIKLKTMTSQCDSNGNLLPDSQRLTRVGKIIRSLSLDEIPQLWLVLIGKMSLIGPRPLMVRYLPLYNSKQKRRHDVKPGITGWAQVKGRNAISWHQKFEYDVYYVDHLSFLLDIRIFFLTIHKILVHTDVNQEGKATVDAFDGTN